MASYKKIIELIASIRTIYPYYAKDKTEAEIKALTQTWEALLDKYPDKAVDVAFGECLKTCKMPPTPADVIEQLNLLVSSLEPSNEELWSLYRKTIRRMEDEAYYLQYPTVGETREDVHARIDKLWNELPERLKAYIGSKGELIRIARSYDDIDFKYEKTKFLKAMPEIKKRVDASRLILLIGADEIGTLPAHKERGLL